MATKAKAPLTAGTVRQGRERDLAGERIDPEHKPSLPERQAEHLQRRFLLPAPIARTVADLHFGRAAA